MPRGGCVIAKRAARGASGLKDGDVVHVPAPPVSVVDTAGAGDAFNGGYLAAIAHRASFLDAITAGVATASRAISTNPREYQPLPAGPASR
jgi:sugar/nucleoside kinase (ribokinase family)